MSKVYVRLIYAEKCSDCAQVKQDLERAIEKTEIDCFVEKILYKHPEAIDLALRYKEISDIPCLIIGNGLAIFNGTKYTVEKISNALVKASKNDS